MTSFQVDRFEASRTADDSVALRLEGIWIAPEPVAVAAPVLLVRSGAALERFEPAQGTDLNPIASPAGDRWSAVFDLPATLLESAESGFALEVAGGLAFALPDPGDAPQAATAGISGSGRPDHEFESLQEAVRELQSRLEAERRARRAAEDQLEQELRGHPETQGSAPVDDRRIAQLQSMVAALEQRMRAAGTLGTVGASDEQLRELEQRLGALEQSNAALERRASEAEREAQLLKAALETTREAHAHAVASALAHEQRASELQSDSTQAEMTVEESRSRLAELEARSAQIEARAAELDAELAQARLASAETPTAIETGPEAVVPRPQPAADDTPDDSARTSEEADVGGGEPSAYPQTARRPLVLLLIVLLAVAVLLGAEAAGLIEAWPINP